MSKTADIDLAVTMMAEHLADYSPEVQAIALHWTAERLGIPKRILASTAAYGMHQEPTTEPAPPYRSHTPRPQDALVPDDSSDRRNAQQSLDLTNDDLTGEDQ